MKKRQLDLKKVFCYPLGPFPWSLADSNGGLKKTSKVSILHELDKDTEPVVEPIVHHVSQSSQLGLLLETLVSKGDFCQNWSPFSLLFG